MKTFVTVGAVDGFDAGTRWSYKELQKQFGPNRIAKMKAAGELLDEDAYVAANLAPAPVAKPTKKGKSKRGEWDLTPLQKQAMDAMYEIGADRTAAEIATAMGVPGQAIKVSGVLSSLVERGAATTRKFKGVTGYWISKDWYDGLGYSSRKA